MQRVAHWMGAYLLVCSDQMRCEHCAGSDEMRNTQGPEAEVRKRAGAVSICRCLYVVKNRHVGSSPSRDRNSFVGDSVALSCMGLPEGTDVIANQPGKPELVDSRVERQMSVKRPLCSTSSQSTTKCEVLYMKKQGSRTKQARYKM